MRADEKDGLMPMGFCYNSGTPMRTLLSCSLALVLLCPHCAQAQKSTATNPYAAEALVIERSDLTYSYHADGTGVRERTVSVRVQSEAAVRELGVLSVPFASAAEKVEFQYVRVRHPDGSVTETPLTGVMEQPEEVTRQAPFYSDLKQAQLPVKNLRVGDTLQWDAKIVRTRPEAPGQFWGQESLVSQDVVVLEQAVELRVPAASAVTVWTNPSLGVKPAESTANGEHVYRWQDAVTKPTTGAEAEAAKKAKKEHVLSAAEVLDEEQGALPSVAWTTFKSWDQVGAWYRTLQGSRVQPDDEIKAKALELTAGAKTTEDKVRALYAYVSTQVRYVGVAFGIGRYQPHEAADVLHNQYGDCKDKQTLLAAMLNAVGIPSDAALIGSGVRFNPDVPSPGAFNHLITHLTLGHEDVWLDSTEEVAPYRMMWATLRDRQALVVPPAGAPHLAMTPKEPPFPSGDTWVAKGKLDAEGTSESRLTLTLRGDDELLLRTVLRQVPPSRYDEAVQKLVATMGYAGTTSHAEVSRPEDTTGPLVISFDYHREKSGDWDNLRILAQVEPDGLPLPNEKEPPTSPLQLGAPRVVLSRAEMQIPDGWHVEPPDSVHEKSRWATCDTTYRVEKNTLYTERKLTILAEKVPANEWKAYKKWSDAVSLDDSVFIQLRRANGLSMPESAEKKDKPATLDEMVKEASDDARKMNITRARELLDDVKAKNANQKGLWGGYGDVAQAEGKANEAVEDYKKELTLHPGEVEVYRRMFVAQASHGDREGAHATLASWVKADEGNPTPAAELAALLYADKKYGESAAMASQALKMWPKDRPDERMRMLLGQAYLKAGKPDEGASLLESILRATDDPGVMNDTAYALADAKRDLPLDEEKVRTALERMETESQLWSLGSTTSEVNRKVNVLIATWDTMGWILFREGKAAEAKTYIEAAFLNNHHDEVKQHLEAVNAALGVHSAAPRPPSTAQQHGRLVVVHSQNEPSSLDAGKWTGGVGGAQFHLLISHGALEGASPISGSTMEGGLGIVSRVDFSKLTPKGSNAKLLRTGILTCMAGRCGLMLQP